MNSTNSNNYLEIKYKQDSSIFSTNGTFTFDHVSKDFIQGFHFVENLYNFDFNRISILESNIEPDWHTIVFQSLISKPKYVAIVKNDEFKSYQFLDSLRIKHDIQITKRYTAFIDNKIDRITIVQFDSLDFLNGVITYNAWINERMNMIDGIFDGDKSLRLNIEHQTSMVDKKLITKQVLDELLIPDIINIVWNYVAIKCNASDDILQCITEMDIISDKLMSETEYSYEVYDSIINGIASFTSSSKTYIRCFCCRAYNNLKPFKCKVTVA